MYLKTIPLSKDNPFSNLDNPLPHVESTRPSCGVLHRTNLEIDSQTNGPAHSPVNAQFY